jgi:hypothetical protein
MCTPRVPIYGLVIWSAWFYLLSMALQNSGYGGQTGPGIKAPALNAYALELEAKAASTVPSELQALQAALTSDSSLLQLNSAEEYAQLFPQTIALSPILARLASNPAPGAQGIFGVLCESPVFLAQPLRAECLLLTLPSVHPLPQAAMVLLRKSVQPENESQDIAINAIFAISSEATLEIFAAQVLNAEQDFGVIQGWMRDGLLRHRRSAPVLAMSLGLLLNPRLDVERKNALVEALFDYRPDEWYQREAPVPKPPTVRKLPAPTLALLQKIAAAVAGDRSISAQNQQLVRAGLAGEGK